MEREGEENVSQGLSTMRTLYGKHHSVMVAGWC